MAHQQMKSAYESFQIGAVGDRDATVAYTSFEGRLYTASAKRHPGDKYDENIAYNLAVARLLGKISRALERHATGTVKHADDMRRDRERRRAQEAQILTTLTDTLDKVRPPVPPKGKHRTDPMNPFTGTGI